MVLAESFANSFTVVVGSATVQQTIHQLRFLNVECNHQIERHPAFCQHAVEGFGLGHSPGKAIEQAATSTILLPKAISNDADHDLVWHKFARVHVTGSFVTEFGAGIL